MNELTVRIHEDNLSIFNEKLKELNEKFAKKGLPLINCSMAKEEMYSVDEYTHEKYSYDLYVATLTSDFNQTNLSGVNCTFEGVVSLVEGNENDKVYTFKNINYSSLLADCSCDKCHKKIGRNKYLVFAKTEEVKSREDLVVLGTSCAKDFFPFDIERYFGFLESAFGELGEYDEFRGSFGGCVSHYHTLHGIYTATLACTDNLKAYAKEGETKGNVLGWLKNLKMNKYEYYRDVYLFPSNPIPFEDVISWVDEMLNKSTEELRSDFEINARSVFFKTNDDGTREMRHEIHEKYMGIAVYAMFASKQNHDKAVAKKLSEEERAKVNAEVTYFGNVGDKFEREMTFEKMFGFETMYGYQYILLFRDSDNHVFKWSTANGSYKLEVGKNVDIVRDVTNQAQFGGALYADYEVGHKYLIKGTIKAHEEYKGVKQTVITRCKVVNDFINRKVEIHTTMHGDNVAEVEVVDPFEALCEVMDSMEQSA